MFCAASRINGRAHQLGSLRAGSYWVVDSEVATAVFRAKPQTSEVVVRGHSPPGPQPLASVGTWEFIRKQRLKVIRHFVRQKMQNSLISFGLRLGTYPCHNSAGPLIVAGSSVCSLHGNPPHPGLSVARGSCYPLSRPGISGTSG